MQACFRLITNGVPKPGRGKVHEDTSTKISSWEPKEFDGLDASIRERYIDEGASNVRAVIDNTYWQETFIASIEGTETSDVARPNR